ncbi:MAG: hypothetical protein JXA89_20090 [Anaerolineae bacterium]|nr:hypothetical protein [Anaerolineae bacterium]
MEQEQMRGIVYHSLIVIVLVGMLAAGCGKTQTAPEATATFLPPTSTPVPTSVPTLTSTPTTVPTPDIPEPERPLLMAHYMPWYQTPSVTGYWGWHWTMDHFSPSRQDENGRRKIASYTYPLTGPYDSSDDALLEYQVLLMRLSGIDGVIVDWYGAEPFWDYAVLNKSTNKLFTAIKEAGLRFAICYEDQSVMHMVDNKHVPAKDVYTHAQDVMRYLQDTWFQDEAYLKVLDQPVLFTFGPQYFKRATDWDTLFSVLDTRPAFITLDGHTESAGLSSYPWPPMWASKNGVLSQEALESYLVTFYRRAVRWDYLVAGAFPGFQDIYQETGISTESRYLDPRGGETFRYTLQMALDQIPDVIQLITWNDYGESTSIEPTEEFGYQYLEMVQEARRATDKAGFVFTADDLRLPFQLFTLRNQYARDAEVNTHLDQVLDAVLAGDLDRARSILADYPIEP